MNVLIAEDDPISRQLLERAVSELGYDAVTAADGLGAWNILRRRDVRLMIADWEMPGMNGLSLCRRVRSGVLPHYVFVLMLTAKSDKEDIVEGLEAGADDYIVKPFARAELRARLRTGQRIIDLEYELSAKNGMLEDLNGRLGRMALTDPLMEIGNRRGLYDTLDRVQASGATGRGCYSLVMCDVDNFKAYNDTYGHAAGDEVLKRIAGAMKKCLRATDGLFRYGGEEIVVYLPRADVEAAREVAERLCRGVRAEGIPHSGSRESFVTISCGVAARAEDAKENESWENVLTLADKALYRAKAAGRNRTEVMVA
jgi:two-component system chemotaxis response regulator CheY